MDIYVLAASARNKPEKIIVATCRHTAPQPENKSIVNEITLEGLFFNKIVFIFLFLETEQLELLTGRCFWNLICVFVRGIYIFLLSEAFLKHKTSKETKTKKPQILQIKAHIDSS